MPLRYYKLFNYLAEKRISKGAFREMAGLTSTTASKLFKGEAVSSETLERICKAFNFQPGDFMEYIPDEEPPDPPKRKDKDRTKKQEAKVEVTAEAPESTKRKLRAEDVKLKSGQILLSVPMPDGTTETVIAWEDDSVELAKKEASVRNARPGSDEKDLAEVMLNRFKFSLKVRSDEYLEKLAG